MKFEIINHAERNLFILKSFGDYSIDNAHRMVKALITHQSWSKDMNLLFDLRETNISHVSTHDLKETADLALSIEKILGNGGRAFVTPSTDRHKVHFYTYSLKLRSDKERKIFSAEAYDQALEWLKAFKVNSPAIQTG